MKKLIALTTTLTLSFVQPSYAQFNQGTKIETNNLNNVEQMLGTVGLVTQVNCTLNNKVLVNVQDRGGAGRGSLCYAPSTQVPAGNYTFNTETGQLQRQCVIIGSSNSCDDKPTTPPPVNGGQPINPYTGQQPSQVPYQPYQPPYQPEVKVVMYSLSGGQVPPHVKAILRGIAAGQNLQLGDCNTAHVHVIVNNTYGFCAYPNATYSVGKWTLNVGGLQ